MIVLVNDVVAERATLIVPRRGRWQLLVVLPRVVEAEEGSSARALVDDVELIGTIIKRSTHGGRLRLEILGGAAWSQWIAPKAYRDDQGVRARVIAEDAARDCGADLEAWPTTSPVTRLGPGYTRREGPASRVLDAATGGAWWVDFGGVTRVGDRPELPDVEPGLALVVDRGVRTVDLTVEPGRLSAIAVGARLVDGLDAPARIVGLELDVTADEARVRAWVDPAVTRSPLVDAVRSIVEQLLAERLAGVYRYRVVGRRGDRVECQRVAPLAGLPDLLPISHWPGVAGTHAELADGAEVLVAFVDADPARPIVVGYAGKDGAGWVPTSFELQASSSAAIVAPSVRLGAVSPSDFAALSSRVDSALEALRAFTAAHTHSGVSTGSGTSGPPTPVLPTTPPYDTGSSIVRVEP